MIINTTLCYLIRDDKYLMLHRTKKEHDINKDKWIGVGGKAEEGESPEDCVRREVWEETGYRLIKCDFRGIVTFVYRDITEYMYLFTSEIFERVTDGRGSTEETRTEDWECDEGDLVWVPRKEVHDLPIWDGDRIFFRLLEEKSGFFSLKLVYDESESLVNVELNGEKVCGVSKQGSNESSQGELNCTIND